MVIQIRKREISSLVYRDSIENFVYEYKLFTLYRLKMRKIDNSEPEIHKQNKFILFEYFKCCFKYHVNIHLISTVFLKIMKNLVTIKI